MPTPDLPLLFGAAIATPLALMAVALVWRSTFDGLKPVPEVLFGLGVATLSAVAIVLADFDTLFNSPLALLAVPFLSYVVALAVISRKPRIHPALVLLGGVVGLAPLWWLLGFVIVGTACGLTADGGC